MPNFNYIASNSSGETKRGVFAASSKSELAQKLKAQGLFLVSCRSDDEKSAAAGAPDPRSLKTTQTAAPLARSSAPTPSNHASAKIHSLFSSLRKTDPSKSPTNSVSLKELVVLTRQLSISINAGMSFVESLQGLVTNTKNPRLSWVMRKVLNDVLAGKRFSDALAAHPVVFTPVYVSMTAAGEAGGFMPEALNRVAEFLEKDIELQSKIKSAMIYPVVIGIVATLVVTGMMLFIVPTFIKVFQDMNAPLPGPTRALIATSNFTRNGGFLLPFVFVALFFYMKRLRKTNEAFRAFWDERVLGVPVFGKLITLEIITRFIRTLASLVSNGVVALQAIGVARQVVENRTIERVVDEIFTSIQQGNGISPVLYRSKHFPVLVANMVSTGEKTGAIPEVLNKMADYYDAEVSAAVGGLLALLEPLLIVVMASIVGFVILGLMLPVLTMSSLVGN